MPRRASVKSAEDPYWEQMREKSPDITRWYEQHGHLDAADRVKYDAELRPTIEGFILKTFVLRHKWTIGEFLLLLLDNRSDVLYFDHTLKERLGDESRGWRHRDSPDFQECLRQVTDAAANGSIQHVSIGFDEYVEAISAARWAAGQYPTLRQLLTDAPKLAYPEIYREVHAAFAVYAKLLSEKQPKTLRAILKGKKPTKQEPPTRLQQDILEALKAKSLTEPELTNHLQATDDTKVKRALRELRERGYIANRRGLGYYLKSWSAL